MLPLALLVLLCSGLLKAAEPVQDEGWPETQQDWGLSPVNEGELHFI